VISCPVEFLRKETRAHFFIHLYIEARRLI
jgi:hypothetical protein